MDVYVISDGTPQRLEQVRCKDEDKELQSILDNNPDLLPGDQIDPDEPRRWLIVNREMPVADPGSGVDRWSLDFLLADQDAVPTLVECKRFRDPRARREVVGQMLDYAANGKEYWSKEQLISMAEKTAQRHGRDLETALKELGPESGTSPDSFFERFCGKLKEGEVRIIFFLEESSHDLRSIADFLNRQMTFAEVLVVEARQYEHSGARIIVPVLIGYRDEIRKIKQTVVISPAADKTLWTKDKLIENTRQRDPIEAEIVEGLIAGLVELGLSTRGLRSGINFGIEHADGFISIVLLYPNNIWLNVAKDGSSRVSAENFIKWKRQLNEIAPCYKVDSLSEPSNKGALGPHYDVISGKIDAFLTAISAIKTEIERALSQAGQQQL